MKTSRAACGIWCVTIALVSSAAWAQTAGSAFTYQGQLKENGMPADGPYDFRFRLLDYHGDPVGGPLDWDDHPVSHGLFSLDLDFGSDVLSGDVRFLEVGVRPGDSLGQYTTLAPLQELTPAPYAATALRTVGVDGHSLDAADGDPTDALIVDDDGRVGVGVAQPAEMLDVGGTAKMTGFQLGDSATPGHVLTTDANGVGTWQAPSGGGSSPWTVGPDDTIYYDDGRVGIGLSAPTTTLDVAGDARVYGGNFHLGAAGFDAYLELMSAEDSDATEMRLKSLDGVGFAVTDSADTPFLVVATSGRVGVGTTAPTHTLQVAGTAEMTGLKLGNSATPGHVLTTNAYGVGTWQAPTVEDLSITTEKLASDAVTSTKIASDAVTSTAIADGTVVAGDIAPETLTSANVNPLGGIYSSKTSVYIVEGQVDADLPGGACVFLSAECADANDLPLFGFGYALGQACIRSEMLTDWDNPDAPAKYAVDFCNDVGALPTFVQAKIACIHVD